ncbi:arsenate reductase family protein [Candidatus Methylacidiphilum infernorum]|uniref:Glutaredoxin family protein n=1 Tax=Methylacidiphilum infernorum (isolate V4) TaxID=481448 RepID=B3DVN4_METI4|nr:arsenate reductase family protein [Candidatus Methylacidiphilum infernorum]ACD83387.1 Glutaredoxin family protein [Methylacidiphilum infernorum V4]
MAEKLFIYVKSSCSTCRRAVALLEELKVDYEKRDYFIHPLSKEKWAELLKKLDVGFPEILRTKEEVFSELGLGKRQLRQGELVELILKHPELIQRPIVEYGTRAILGRPPEKIKEFLHSLR